MEGVRQKIRDLLSKIRNTFFPVLGRGLIDEWKGVEVRTPDLILLTYLSGRFVPPTTKVVYRRGITLHSL